MFGMARFVSVLAPAATAVALLGCSGTSDGGLTDPPDPNNSLVCSIPSDKIFSGGVARDGIPALTNPEVGPADQSVMGDEDRVLGLVVGGQARAYPIGILWWHEVINDTLGGLPVLVSYCPLTGSGLAFDPRINGELRNFGVSGLLFENNLIMFDRTNESLWNQLLLGSQCGPDRGTALTRLPMIEATWGQWKRMHPTTTFVTTNTGFFQDYRLYPYDNYDDLNNPDTLFPTSRFSTKRPPKELILGVQDGSSAVAFPFGTLTERGLVVALNDSVGTTPLLVMFLAGEQTAIGFDRRVDGQTLTFSVADFAAPTFRDAETGSTWDATGVATAGPLQGAKLAMYPDAVTLFWFSWSVYYPTTRLFE